MLGWAGPCGTIVSWENVRNGLILNRQLLLNTKPKMFINMKMSQFSFGFRQTAIAFWMYTFNTLVHQYNVHQQYIEVLILVFLF